MKKIHFHPVIKVNKPLPVFDFTEGFNTDEIERKVWGIGRYNEKRKNMYLAPQYENRRNIHMGMDIWCPAGEPVYSAWDAEVVYMANHAQTGNYGPTIVLKHEINEVTLFALHGHLSLADLDRNFIGKILERGEVFANVGTRKENGDWPPHLHYQLSRDDPGKADMPGVVSEDELAEALKKYPDPDMILNLCS
ncbi:MAG: peptidoglycan DD-metalloendopeptidase family protein [Balneolaceae bacterium]